LIHRVLTVGLCLLTLSAVSVAAANGPTAGVVVGTNITSAQLTGADATGINSGQRAGLFLGAFVLVPLAGVVGIQPEVAYSQKHFTVQDTIGSFTATEKWDWIEVPILARVSFWHSGDTSAYVVVGPGFGFLARAKEETEGTTSDVKDDVKRVDVSIIAGAGVSMGKFGVEARYDGGLKDLNKDNALGDALTVKGRTIRVDILWMFR
jgi:hypothetical protein